MYEMYEHLHLHHLSGVVSTMEKKHSHLEDKGEPVMSVQGSKPWILDLKL